MSLPSGYVATITTKQVLSSGDGGFDAGRLERVRRSIEADVESGVYDGAALAIGRSGNLAALHLVGFADRAAGAAIDENTRYVLFSVGKHFVTAVVLSYVEQGLLALHRPVADVLPAFGCRGKDKLALWHLLTHTAGLPANVPVPPSKAGSIEYLTSLVAGLAPDAPPGEHVVYSMAAAHAVMASMLLAVNGNGRSFTQLMHDELFDPLGMRATSVGPPTDGAPVAPVVTRYTRAGKFLGAEIEGAARAILTPGAEYPGGGYVTSIGDLYRFADMLRGGGALDGVRILSPAMIELATRNWTGDRPALSWYNAIELRHWQPWPACSGLGFSVRGTAITPGPLPNLASERAFGGFGAGTTCYWVDPQRDVCVALLTTGVLEETDHITRTQRLSDMVLAALTV